MLKDPISQNIQDDECLIRIALRLLEREVLIFLYDTLISFFAVKFLFIYATLAMHEFLQEYVMQFNVIMLDGYFMNKLFNLL